jgi:hypothetical protein
LLLVVPDIDQRKQTMKKSIFTVLVVLLLGAVALGFYRGWFAVSNPEANEGSNKVNVNLTMDPDKMKADAAAVQHKTAELTGTAAESANPPDTTPAAAPRQPDVR